MATKEIAIQKDVVRSSRGERSLLETLIRKGCIPARWLLKARILLVADVSESRRRVERQPDHRGSDNQPSHGLPGAQATGGRRRRGRVVPRATLSVPRIFDGGKEAKPNALACCEPFKGRVRWTSRLDNKAVELNCKSLGLIHRSMSDLAIHRTGEALPARRGSRTLRKTQQQEAIRKVKHNAARSWRSA